MNILPPHFPWRQTPASGLCAKKHGRSVPGATTQVPAFEWALGRRPYVSEAEGSIVYNVQPLLRARACQPMSVPPVICRRLRLHWVLQGPAAVAASSAPPQRSGRGTQRLTPRGGRRCGRFTRRSSPAKSLWCSSWRAGCASRRRDCHFADIPSPLLLKRLLKGEGVQQDDSLADG